VELCDCCDDSLLISGARDAPPDWVRGLPGFVEGIVWCFGWSEVEVVGSQIVVSALRALSHVATSMSYARVWYDDLMCNNAACLLVR
jgi:hypothetical protein